MNEELSLNPPTKRAHVAQGPLLARASYSAYVALWAAWFILALINIALYLKNRPPGVGTTIIILLLVGVGWITWLRGFRIAISDERLAYRDGLYKSITIPLDEVCNAKMGWTEWQILTRILKVPRLLVTYGANDEVLAINAKPFHRKDIKRALELLHVETSVDTD